MMGTRFRHRTSWPPALYSRAHQLAIVTVAASVAHGLLMQMGKPWLEFIPLRTLRMLELWRPFTSLFVATDPLQVIFGALIIYSIGGALESRWGAKRFLSVVLGIPFIAESIILISSLLVPSFFIGARHAGSFQVITTLWITFGLSAHFSRELLQFWGTPITGKTFAMIGLGFVVLAGVFNGFFPVLPELLTAALCYLYMYRGRSSSFFRRIEVRYYEWKLRRLRHASGFRVIKGSKDEDSDSQIH